MSPRYTSRHMTVGALSTAVAVNVMLALALAGQLFDLLDPSSGHLWLIPAAGLTVLVIGLLVLRAVPAAGANSAPNGELLIQYAYHDELTKLPNRLLLRDRLAVQLAATRRSNISVALLMIDLDEFKRINDALGHLAGDELLVQVAERLSETCRETDTVARLGGDEFVVVQAIEHRDQASILANRIIANLSRPFDLGKGQVTIGCSIGATIAKSPDARLEDLIDEADFVLYRSKKLGGNALTVFDPAADTFRQADKGFETELIRGLEHGEVGPRYSGLFDGNGQLAGFDTVLSWDHPKSGLLDLRAILSLIHDRRLAWSITDHYLGEVAKAGSWFPTLQITFNMLPFAAPERRLVDQLCSDEFNLLRRGSTCFLGVGLAELERIGLRGVALVDELEAHGYGLVLDCSDSSIATLRTIARLRPWRLRINGQLVDSLNSSDQAATAVRELCDLGRSRGIEVIADGVTSVEQSALLTSFGCDLQQGPRWGTFSDIGTLMAPAAGARAIG